MHSGVANCRVNPFRTRVRLLRAAVPRCPLGTVGVWRAKPEKPVLFGLRRASEEGTLVAGGPVLSVRRVPLPVCLLQSKGRTDTLRHLRVPSSDVYRERSHGRAFLHGIFVAVVRTRIGCYGDRTLSPGDAPFISVLRVSASGQDWGLVLDRSSEEMLRDW